MEQVNRISPSISEYLRLAKAHPDCLIAIRIGDFYEWYNDAAETVAKVLNITLTGRNRGDNERMPMCGVPYHSVEKYLAKLVEAGLKVALLDHIEDPVVARNEGREPERALTRLEVGPGEPLFPKVIQTQCDPPDDNGGDGDDVCDKCMRSGVVVSQTDDEGNTICVDCAEDAE
jgi:hypothetical protein